MKRTVEKMRASAKARKRRQRERDMADRQMRLAELENATLKTDDDTITTNTTSCETGDGECALPKDIMDFIDSILTKEETLRRLSDIESLDNVDSLRKVAIDLRSKLHSSQLLNEKLVTALLFLMFIYDVKVNAA